jgi:hypothetical protein
MANPGKTEESRSFPVRPGSSGHPVEMSPVEARQAHREGPVFYVLVVCLVLIIVAYIVIGSLWMTT